MGLGNDSLIYDNKNTDNKAKSRKMDYIKSKNLSATKKTIE